MNVLPGSHLEEPHNHIRAKQEQQELPSLLSVEFDSICFHTTQSWICQGPPLSDLASDKSKQVRSRPSSHGNPLYASGHQKQ